MSSFGQAGQHLSKHTAYSCWKTLPLSAAAPLQQPAKRNTYTFNWLLTPPLYLNTVRSASTQCTPSVSDLTQHNQTTPVSSSPSARPHNTCHCSDKPQTLSHSATC
jgi:hypothetical protein